MKSVMKFGMNFEMLNSNPYDTNYNYLINILNEAQEVNSEGVDDSTDNNANGSNGGNGGNKLSDDQVMQVAQAYVNGELTDQDIQQQLQSGNITEDDLQAIQQAVQQLQSQNEQDLTPEQKEELFKQQIDSTSDTFIRITLYDKFNELKTKLENFIDNNLKTNNEIDDKLKYLKNYIEILTSLTYSMDVNLLYQMYVSIEIKLINLIRESLGLGEDDEIEGYFDNLIKDNKEKEKIFEKYSPDNIANEILNGNMTIDEFQQLIQQLQQEKVYTDEEIKQLQQQVMNIVNTVQQEQQPAQEDQINPDQIAMAIVNGEIDPNEVVQSFQQGQIPKEIFQEIIQKIDEYKNSQNQNNQIPTQPVQQPQQQKTKPQNPQKPQKPQEVNSDAAEPNA